MLLYSKFGGTVVDAPEGHFEAGPDGGFALPAALHQRLHAAHVNGKRMWEDEIERGERLHLEDLARRQDPATLYASVAGIADLFQKLAAQYGQPGGQQLPPDDAAELERLRAEVATLREQAGTAEPAKQAGRKTAKAAGTP